MARNQFWVSPNGESWVVTNQGRQLERHYQKVLAVEAGVRIARANQPSELFIQNRMGRIEDRRTYGNDPFPPRG
jgi:Uncharacterized protein conserved in bacteria (DUF2188)